MLCICILWASDWRVSRLGVRGRRVAFVRWRNQKAITRVRTNRLRNIFLLWNWTLTYNLHLLIWPIKWQGESACQIPIGQMSCSSTGLVSTHPDKHKHASECASRTTKVNDPSIKFFCSRQTPNVMLQHSTAPVTPLKQVSKVIWQTAASPSCHFLWFVRSWPPILFTVPWININQPANGISIDPAVFAQLTRVPNTQIHR